MHAIIHRGLTPQSLSHIWLVLTLALTLVLAVGQSAVAHATAAGAPSVAPMVMQLAAAPLGQGPIGHHDSGGCRAAADAEERAAVGDPRPPGPWTCSSHPPRAAAAIVPPLELFAPDPRAGSDSLVAIYGGVGPHGPPAAAATQEIPSVLPQRTTPRTTPRTTLRAAFATTPAAPLFPTGPTPAITTVA